MTQSSTKRRSNIIYFFAGILVMLVAFCVYLYMRMLNAPLDAPHDVLDTIDAETSSIETTVAETTTDAEAEVPYLLPTYTVSDVYEGREETTYRYDTENSITVALAENEGVMLHGMGATTETDTTVAGHTARRIVGSSAKDGSRVDALVVELGSEQILFARGTTDFVEDVAANLELQ